MAATASLQQLLRLQERALGRGLPKGRILRRVIERRVGGRPYSRVIRRISPPDMYRDDLWTGGAWRFSEGFDGSRGWYRDHDHPRPTEAVRAQEHHRWAGVRLDHLQPLAAVRRLGCTVEDGGIQHTARGEAMPTVTVSLGRFAETVFVDAAGRIAAHRLDLPPADEEERELEQCVLDWGACDGLVHPVRSVVLDRRTGETIAEIIVAEARLERGGREVFTLVAD